MASRWERKTAGSSLASTAKTARSALRLGLGDLVLQHGDLVAEDHDLGVLGCLARPARSSQPKTRVMI